MESIEKGYVLVNAHCASMDAFSYYLGTSLQDKSTTRVSVCPSRKNDWDLAVAMPTVELADSSLGCPASAQSHGSNLLVASSASSILREVQGLTILHPSTRLHLLHQYVQALAELSQEKVSYLMLLALVDIVLMNESDGITTMYTYIVQYKESMLSLSLFLYLYIYGEYIRNQCNITWMVGFLVLPLQHSISMQIIVMDLCFLYCWQ